jgi:hypothetical protein
MSESQITVLIDSAEQHEGILTEQVENCPTCLVELEFGFGLAGGGFGAYGYCSKCERVIWKCQVDE